MSSIMSNLQDETISSKLAHFFNNLKYDDLPEQVIHRAKLHILDALGIAVASSIESYSKVSFNSLEDICGTGDYQVIGFDRCLPYREAAVMNGFLIHSLDYDDTHVAGVIHASASAIPAVLAAAIKYNADAHKALVAYIIGVETSARIGMAARGGFHKRGFHPTGLVGCFGATMAAGTLAGLSVSELTHAQGIVYSMAAGNLEFLEQGAWTKRLHPGWAAGCALTAISFAKNGFQGPLSPYEGRFGLYKTCSSDEIKVDYKLASSSLGDDWEMLKVGIKPYPACHLTHACIDASREIRNNYNVTFENIKHITARVHPESMPVICDPIKEKRRPKNSYEAQFSLPYLVASAICRDRVSLVDLENEAFTNLEILSLCDRISCEPMKGSLYPRYFSGEVEVTTLNGEIFTVREEINRGADKKPLDENEIINKFIENASLVMASDQVRLIVDHTMELEGYDSLSYFLDNFIKH